MADDPYMQRQWSLVGKMTFVELYFKHHTVSLDELYERTMAEAKVRGRSS